MKLAATAERERIARDLHDVLGHTLSVIVLKAELAGRLMQCDPARAAVEIADVEHTARTALAEVREAITGYRSKGLAQEIDKTRLCLDAAGVRLECETVPPVLDAAEETVMALALREAATKEVWSAEPDPLTDRERQILQRAGEGRSSAEIAAGLRLSEGTVRNSLSEAISKLGASNRTDAARIARAKGWL